MKYVVDAWKNAKAPAAIEARIIEKNEFSVEEREYDICPGCGYIQVGLFAKDNWIYNNNYESWTGSIPDNSDGEIFTISTDGRLYNADVYSSKYVVRPVIVLSKSLLSNE